MSSTADASRTKARPTRCTRISTCAARSCGFRRTPTSAFGTELPIRHVRSYGEFRGLSRQRADLPKMAIMTPFGHWCDQPPIPSFDYLVGAAKQRQRDGEAKRLGSLQIDDQLDLGRPHDRQVAGALALENPA